ncbi:methyltransferase type 11 [Mesorhizobium sp. L-8-10]|uniref:small ribosomal subunit Rsm22 family protein n=1 Tax=Mesorhizobium sp. L-8-10 TaxID=2744523 RepID=UPI001928A7B9|nr:small ribosomal subunit Rsm22 family protein [Mesorhizobium sp. L-8-10]BCH33822.1 methyltransferase type 11 [Mesorhizobium sp. L-8-10]
MELPAALRRAVDRLLEGIPVTELQKAAGLLSARYRAEVRDGRLHLDDRLAVKAYLATRLPATFAAVRASLASVAELRPDFAPGTMLDLGAGPGTVLWAAADCWPTLGDAVHVEASAAARQVGEALAGDMDMVGARWLAGDVTGDMDGLAKADLVTLSYVLDEIDPKTIGSLIGRLWELTEDTLVIVEPGTPAGWSRILAARQRLVEEGAHLVAPCPHSAPCPLAAPDWCHFARRVARSRLHRLTKGADVPWEDEKYVFIAASRHAGNGPAARVVAPPRAAKGKVTLKLCRQDGSAAERTVTKREGDAFRTARRLDWGEAAPWTVGGA